MIIFNEHEYVSNIVATHEKPPKMGIKRLIRYLIMFRIDENRDSRPCDFAKSIMEELDEFHFNPLVYRRFEYAGYIKSLCRKYLKGELSANMLNCEKIDITRKEIDIVKSANTEKEQRVLFTLFALSKVVTKQSGWVNYSMNDIFAYANVNCSKKEKHEIINSLYSQGLIELSNSLKVYGYKVELQDDIDDVAITITEFEDFGKQYVDSFVDGWMMCKRCRRLIRRRNNRQMYCKKCANEINAERARERQTA